MQVHPRPKRGEERERRASVCNVWFAACWTALLRHLRTNETLLTVDIDNLWSARNDCTSNDASRASHRTNVILHCAEHPVSLSLVIGELLLVSCPESLFRFERGNNTCINIRPLVKSIDIWNKTTVNRLWPNLNRYFPVQFFINR